MRIIDRYIARAAGMSVWRLSLTLILIGLGLAGATAAIGEYIAPQSTLIAQIERAAARTLQEGAMQGSTVWLRNGSRYLRVESIATQPTARTLTTFEVADDHAELVSIGHAEAVAISASDAWTLQDYRRIWYSNEGVRATTDAEHLLHVRAGGALLDAAIDPADRSMRDLARLIREFERNRQDARRLVFARSSRAAHAASATWCVLLALPFGFGSLRSARAGVRLFIAIGIGIAFVLGQQVVQSGVVLTSLPPTLLAWLPTSTLALVTSFLVRRLA